MRTALLVLSTAFVLAACADDQHTTAPGSARSAAGSVASATVEPGTQAPINQGKPSSGFSLVTTVKSANVQVNAGTVGSATATCPAGSQVIGGGYFLNGYAGQFAIDLNGPNASNGWTVHGALGNLGPFVVITVTAFCIQ